jgi:hypothetical protein
MYRPSPKVGIPLQAPDLPSWIQRFFVVAAALRLGSV